MSSTRRSITGEFHQERFCSAPEFEGDTINGLAVTKRIAIVKDRATREILWWIQWLSLTPGRLQELCDELVATFPERIGTPTLRELQKDGDRELSEREVSALEKESNYHFFASARDFLPDLEPYREAPVRLLSELTDQIAEEFTRLRDTLIRFCLDPQEDIVKGVWYFEDLLGALTILRERSMAAARARMADTEITRTINDTLDFFLFSRSMVLVEGEPGLGKSESAEAWCDASGGMVRYVEVPSSSDDRSFYAAIARRLGIARGASFKAQQIKVRIEEMLISSELMLLLDEAQFLWGQAMRPRKTPDRLLWINSMFNAGSPVALMATPEFSKWQEHFVAHTLWPDEQFERRLNRRLSLPKKHSMEDLLKIAQAHFPDGDRDCWEMLAAYAKGVKKKQASGIKEALKSAAYRAKLAGRSVPGFEDIEAALIHDHCFLSAKPCDALQSAGRADSEALQVPCNGRATPPRRTAGKADFPIRIDRQSDRITSPTIAL